MAVAGGRVLIADSQRLFARSLGMTLEKAGGFELIDTYPGTGIETIKLAADPAASCDIVILDYWIRGMTGPAATRTIRRTPVAPQVILTGWFHTNVEVSEGFRAGAAAFASKSARLSEFMEVIRRIASGDNSLYKLEGTGVEPVHLPPIPRDEVWERLMTLTVREIEVLSLLAFAPVEKVAKQLSISLGTLRNHIYSILRKTQARSQIEAIDIARRVGLIDS